MLSQITFRQLSEWGAYAELEPFDEERADLRAGSIVQAILNVNRGKRRPYTLKDCVLPFGAEPVKPAPTAKKGDPKVDARDQIKRTMDLLTLIHSRSPGKKQARP